MTNLKKDTLKDILLESLILAVVCFFIAIVMNFYSCEGDYISLLMLSLATSLGIGIGKFLMGLLLYRKIFFKKEEK
ncbi:MAG: hypothetical protein PHE89_02465 [Alphaproteobacteria bacterium]|nr:hypothetical protein [Alphaproteobacteria bacterium]